MKYRPEIDGLRAFAVVPVLLFHAGIWPVTGGYIGVDVFFVISGFLITSILIQELASDRYSIVNFYERRARRILPALFLVMAVSAAFCYIYMLPDELKRFGQSVLATTLFSNNILLTLTSGYWEMASDFKPLLHTWSLGVEEQYYIFFPIYLYFGWKYFRRALVPSLAVIGLVSLAAAAWGVRHMPDATFYLLPTRSWELLIGSLAAFYINSRSGDAIDNRFSQVLSAAGLVMIVGSAVLFDSHTPTPGPITLIPTVGTALIILYAAPATLAYRVLTQPIIVGIGLVSYSAYLWHNPLFVFARVFSVETPSPLVFAGLIVVTFALAYLSWRYVEKPFRTKGVLGRQFVFSATAAASVAAIAVGFYFHQSHGIPTRMYAKNDMQFDDMYKSYNRRAFDYKKDAFADASKLRLLIVGNSFGRDFVNMTLESFDTSRVELVYRDDMPACLKDAKGSLANLIEQSDMIAIANDIFAPACAAPNVALAEDGRKTLFYIGTKHFGRNLNWLMQLPNGERANQFNAIPEDVLDLEKSMASTVPAPNFVSLMAPVRAGDRIPITDERGRLISPDRMHVTKQGATFFGNRALQPSAYGVVLQSCYVGRPCQIGLNGRRT